MMLMLMFGCAPKKSTDFNTTKSSETPALLEACVPETYEFLECTNPDTSEVTEYATIDDLLNQLFAVEDPRCATVDGELAYEGFDSALACLSCTTQTVTTVCPPNGDDDDDTTGDDDDDTTSGDDDDDDDDDDYNTGDDDDDDDDTEEPCVPNYMTTVQCNNPNYEQFNNLEELLNQAFAIEEAKCIKLDNVRVYEGIICGECIQCETVTTDLNNCPVEDDGENNGGGCNKHHPREDGDDHHGGSKKHKHHKKKGNNGHGNNHDGVDVSNPGKGHGGPNGKDDPSGEEDDEKH